MILFLSHLAVATPSILVFPLYFEVIIIANYRFRIITQEI